MRTQFSKLALVATLGLALAFIFSCSVSDDDKIVYGPSVNYGGETYETVVIGKQTWFKRNLNYGTRYCYDNLEVNCDKYGGLYEWATAMALPASCNSSSCSSRIGAKHQGICPDGWHIPSADEWTTLTDFIGARAGTKLKSTSGWNGDGNGTNVHDFSALPGGFGGSDGDFYDVGKDGGWWTATEYNADYAYYRYMYYGYADVYSDYDGKTFFYSVRCVQD